jgi:hypothetical protein
MFSFIRNVAADFGLTNQTHWSTFGSCLFWTRFWLDFGSILAIFLAVVCNSIHPLASIPAFAMPEAEDQVQNLTFTSGSTIYPSSITSDSAPQSDSYPAATISSSTASMLLPQPPHRHRPISAHVPNLAFCSTLRHPPPNQTIKS